MALISVHNFLRFVFHTPIAAFSSEVVRCPLSQPLRGFLSVQKLLLLHNSFPKAQVLSRILCGFLIFGFVLFLMSFAQRSSVRLLCANASLIYFWGER